MKKIVSTLLILLNSVFCSSGCANEATLSEPVTYYSYNGIVVSIVKNQSDYNEVKGHESLYILGLSDFQPDKQIFADYLSMYSEPEGYKHLRMTAETQIYQQTENRRTLADLSALEIGTSVEVWIYYFSEHPQHVFVKEIIIK